MEREPGPWQAHWTFERMLGQGARRNPQPSTARAARTGLHRLSAGGFGAMYHYSVGPAAAPSRVAAACSPLARGFSSVVATGGAPSWSLRGDLAAKTPC